MLNCFAFCVVSALDLLFFKVLKTQNNFVRVFERICPTFSSDVLVFVQAQDLSHLIRVISYDPAAKQTNFSDQRLSHIQPLDAEDRHCTQRLHLHERLV